VRGAVRVKDVMRGGVLGKALAFSGSPCAPAVEPEGPGPEGSGAPALVEVVFGYGLRVDGIERGDGVAADRYPM
jgi:hypothetical protein